MTANTLRTVRRSALVARILGLLLLIALVLGVVIDAGSVGDIITSAVGGVVGVTLALLNRTPG